MAPHLPRAPPLHAAVPGLKFQHAFWKGHRYSDHGLRNLKHGQAKVTELPLEILIVSRVPTVHRGGNGGSERGRRLPQAAQLGNGRGGGSPALSGCPVVPPGSGSRGLAPALSELCGIDYRMSENPGLVQGQGSGSSVDRRLLPASPGGFSRLCNSNAGHLLLTSCVSRL